MLTIIASSFFASPGHAADPADAVLKRLKDPAEIAALARSVGRDPVFAMTVLQWLYVSEYTDSVPTPVLKSFIQKHPDWPNESKLRRQIEAEYPKDTRPYDTVAWFDAHKPLTFDGLIHYTTALETLGHEDKRAKAVKTYWKTGGVSKSEFKTVLSRFSPLLSRQDHAARADKLIWSRRLSEAEMLLPLLSKADKALMRARIHLAQDKAGVDAAVSAVPQSLQNDRGLIYERAKWRRNAKNNTGAIELLNIKGGSHREYADKFWLERHIIARRAIERKDYADAYKIASAHRQTSGLPFAQAEFLSGWLALRYLNKPELALAHFTKLRDNVKSPISLARGHYWTGRAQSALGQSTAAIASYTSAAQYPHTFYGQQALNSLRVLKAKIPPINIQIDPDPIGENCMQAPAKWIRAILIMNDLKLSHHSGALFSKALGEAKSIQDLACVTHIAEKVNRPDQGIRAATKLFTKDGVLRVSAYPDIELKFQASISAPPSALILGLIRQESRFHSQARSHVGAGGLMQLMPGTAKETARKIGIGYSQDKLYDVPAYNITLGSYYLAGLLERYDNNAFLAVAAYNAGYGRINEVIETMGDPRTADVNTIDWIESVPIYETRNYIQRVMEAYSIYRYLEKRRKTAL